MARYRGLTWDHPRGRLALERAAAGAITATGEPLIEWDVQSLEGFESAPIAATAARYDVIVLDHPHLGEALAQDSLQPLDELFDPHWLAGLDEASVGPSIESYRMANRLWALPLDAATQVAVRAPERVTRSPQSWQDVDRLADEVPVALSLAGPHAFLSFASLCAAMGAPGSVDPGSGFVHRSTGIAALELLRGIAERMPKGTTAQNPIGLLERMRTERDIAYIPLIYGYVTYATGQDPLVFDDAPAGPDGHRGSTIGGTGFALSARREMGDDLLTHLRGLLEPDAQRSFIPQHAGQPSRRDAWTDPTVNAAAGNFYRRTLATIESAWVRPRVDGFIAFQSAASALVRAAILGDADPDHTLSHLDVEFDRLGASSPAERTIA
ncbi:extracellular solute-binding protein [Microbacterium sp. Sa4CUA7]|uniref:Extracellular solute-binding protein n=1 Tax=Microbacterium pullorum TaxID=2762236 RepID=A0ABR8S2N4_9MICO|nr:extracellular solute-binding protein [Microbacterium pullorum]MBD7957730.1 extracellular solute-binding protein [Microbacterium pullorum]